MSPAVRQAEAQNRKMWIRRAHNAVLAGIVALVVSLGIMWFNNQLARPPLTAIDRTIDDIALQIRQLTHQDNFLSTRDLVIIDIDDISIAELGRVQLWPRQYDAEVIGHISSGEPKIIILDALYTEADSLPGAYMNLLEEKGFSQASQIIGAMSTDHIMASSIEKAGNVIMGMFDREMISNQDETEAAALEELLPPVFSSAQVSRYYYQRASPVLPIADFAQNALGIGLLKLHADADGTLRRYTLFQRSGKFTANDADSTRLLPSFIIPAIAHLLELSYDEIAIQSGRVQLGPDKSIPVNRRSEFLLNWLGQSENFRKISFSNILNKSVPAAFFKDKIVFLGSSAAGLEDLKSTPVNRVMPGVEVHATALFNVLNNSWLESTALHTVLLILSFTALVLSFLFTLVAQLKALLIGLGILALQFFGYILVIVPEFTITFPISLLLLLTINTFISASILKNSTEEKEKRKLKRAFSSYVAPEIVEELIASGQDPKLGGSESNISAFFSDIQSFSKISEKLEPAQVVILMNEYLEAMTDIINDERGTLDKYIGDAIVAFFGAPVPFEAHAYRACLASQYMLTAERELIKKWRSDKKDWPEDIFALRTRIGISSGVAITGNMGSVRRFNYTMMGDTVNLAARCESGAKQYGAYTVVTKQTRRQAEAFGNECLFRNLDTVLVAGRDTPVELSEILCLQSDATAETRECVELYEQGLQHYYQRNWAKATEFFTKSALIELRQPSAYPGIITNPSLTMLDRVAKLSQTQAGHKFNGVFKLSQK